MKCAYPMVKELSRNNPYYVKQYKYFATTTVMVPKPFCLAVANNNSGASGMFWHAWRFQFLLQERHKSYSEGVSQVFQWRRGYWYTGKQWLLCLKLHADVNIFRSFRSKGAYIHQWTIYIVTKFAGIIVFLSLFRYVCGINGVNDNSSLLC